MTKRVFAIILEVETEDGPAAFDYIREAMDESVGEIQDKICRRLEASHPVNMKFTDARVTLAPLYGVPL